MNLGRRVAARGPVQRNNPDRSRSFGRKNTQGRRGSLGRRHTHRKDTRPKDTHRKRQNPSRGPHRNIRGSPIARKKERCSRDWSNRGQPSTRGRCRTSVHGELSIARNTVVLDVLIHCRDARFSDPIRSFDRHRSPTGQARADSAPWLRNPCWSGINCWSSIAAASVRPSWGCPRIAQQIALAFGVEIDKDVVRRLLSVHYRPESDSGGGPSWLTFLGHMKDSLWSCDLFRCESATLRTHWVLVVMDQFTRRVIGFGVHRGIVDGVALCRMFQRAIRGAQSAKIPQLGS